MLGTLHEIRKVQKGCEYIESSATKTGKLGKGKTNWVPYPSLFTRNQDGEGTDEL